jgi:hypothetical protein
MYRCFFAELMLPLAAAAAVALQAITRKTRILDVNYNASNNELVSSTQQQQQQQQFNRVPAAAAAAAAAEVASAGDSRHG